VARRPAGAGVRRPGPPGTFCDFVALFLSGLTARAHADVGEAGAIAGRLLEVGPSDADNENRGGDRAMLPAATSPRSYQPLTGKERWNLYLREAFWSPGVFFRAAGPALGERLSNEPPAWGEGAEGYSRRFANRFGRFAVQETYEAGRRRGACTRSAVCPQQALRLPSARRSRTHSELRDL
jgi:hypothetical protein